MFYGPWLNEGISDPSIERGVHYLRQWFKILDYSEGYLILLGRDGFTAHFVKEIRNN